MANRKSRKPTRSKPTPITDARRRLFAALDREITKYQKESSADTSDIAGVMMFYWLGKVIAQNLFKDEWGKIMAAWDTLNGHLNDVKAMADAWEARTKNK